MWVILPSCIRNANPDPVPDLRTQLNPDPDPQHRTLPYFKGKNLFLYTLLGLPITYLNDLYHPNILPPIMDPESDSKHWRIRDLNYVNKLLYVKLDDSMKRNYSRMYCTVHAQRCFNDENNKSVLCLYVKIQIADFTYQQVSTLLLYLFLDVPVSHLFLTTSVLVLLHSCM